LIVAPESLIGKTIEAKGVPSLVDYLLGIAFGTSQKTGGGIFRG
jgi:hypothetical protein